MEREWVVLLVSASFGCSSSVSDFEGTWDATSLRSTSACLDDEYFEPEPQFSIELRAGEDSDLELIEHNPATPETANCVVRLSVDGKVATLEERASCSYSVNIYDPEAMADRIVVFENIFYKDRLELVGDGKLEEEISSEVRSEAATNTCPTETRISYQRH
jgi:hypothetical protein